MAGVATEPRRLVAGLVSPEARLVDAATGRQWSGDRLTAAVDAVAEAVGALPAGPVLCLTRNDADAVLRYLGVRAAGRPAMLIDAGLPAAEVADLVTRFAPSAVVGLTVAGSPPGGAYPGGRRPGGSPVALARPDLPPPGYVAAEPAVLGPSWIRGDADGPPPHPDLALLLATSGSTGRPRLVRQAQRSVRASAAAIGAALSIDAAEVAITALPLYYTLGLSVLHSHLFAGRPWWSSLRACSTGGSGRAWTGIGSRISLVSRTRSSC